MTELPCPVCARGTILIVPRQLLAGAAFACPECAAEVALTEASRPVVADGLDQLDRLRANHR
ncbi:MAG: hypothetical protein KGN34_06615 [Sphingomonadales bacterium]|nr:hypothetical protein [Sphingomonadales bacterium]